MADDEGKVVTPDFGGDKNPKIASSDTKGHNVRFQIRIPPWMHAAIMKEVYNPKSSSKDPGDVGRKALAEYLERRSRGTGMEDEVDDGLYDAQLVREEEQYAEYLSIMATLNRTFLVHQREGEESEGRMAIIQAYHRLVTTKKQSVRRSRFEKAFRKNFGHILAKVPPPRRTANLTDLDDREED